MCEQYHGTREQCMNSMGYCSYTSEKKKKANAELKMWIQIDTKVRFGLGLFMSAFYSFMFLPFFFFFLPEIGFTWGTDLPVRPVHNAQDPLAFWTSTHWFEVALFVGPMHYSQDPQTSFFTQTLFKNGSHSTIHIFKNYFVTVFSVFNKISCIQTGLKRGSNKR